MVRNPNTVRGYRNDELDKTGLFIFQVETEQQWVNIWALVPHPPALFVEHINDQEAGFVSSKLRIEIKFRNANFKGHYWQKVC